MRWPFVIRETTGASITRGRREHSQAAAQREVGRSMLVDNGASKSDIESSFHPKPKAMAGVTCGPSTSPARHRLRRLLN